MAGLRGTSDGGFEFGFTGGGGHRPYFLTRRAALWLKQQLGFPNWTEAAIRAMPETHISEWAKAHGVFTDKLYATEEHAGGTMVIGDGVPGYDRGSLSVFSVAEWEQMKPVLVFDSWVSAATAASP